MIKSYSMNDYNNWRESLLTLLHKFESTLDKVYFDMFVVSLCKFLDSFKNDEYSTKDEINVVNTLHEYVDIITEINCRNENINAIIYKLRDGANYLDDICRRHGFLIESEFYFNMISDCPIITKEFIEKRRMEFARLCVENNIQYMIADFKNPFSQLHNDGNYTIYYYGSVLSSELRGTISSIFAPAPHKNSSIVFNYVSKYDDVGYRSKEELLDKNFTLLYDENYLVDN